MAAQSRDVADADVFGHCDAENINHDVVGSEARIQETAYVPHELPCMRRSACQKKRERAELLRDRRAGSGRCAQERGDRKHAAVVAGRLSVRSFYAVADCERAAPASSL